MKISKVLKWLVAGVLLYKVSKAIHIVNLETPKELEKLELDADNIVEAVNVYLEDVKSGKDKEIAIKSFNEAIQTDKAEKMINEYLDKYKEVSE